jgi:hypothetical protein
MSSLSGTPEWWTRLSSPGTGKPDTGRGPSAADLTIQLTLMTYFWWLIVGGVGEILFGGMYLGGVQAAGLDLSTPWSKLLYVAVGIAMVTMGQGILRLEAWVVWAGCILALVLGSLAVWEITRFVTGANLTLQTKIFDCLNVLFALSALSLAARPEVRRMMRYPPFRSGHFSPPLTIFGSVLLVAALAIALEVTDVDTHLSIPVLALVYLLGFALMIVMAFGALGLHTWTWVAGCACTAVLLALSVDVIVRRLTGSGVNVQGLIFSIVNILVVANVVYYLLRLDVRKAFIHRPPKEPAFFPPMLIGGLLLAVAALVIYLLPGELGTPALAYTVLGLAAGAVVGLLPHANPVVQLCGFVLGLLLAFASFVVRGGLLPYTKLSSALVVLLLLAIITGITALFRSSAWFVAMLLGAGTFYGAVEVTFQALPSAYLAASTVALASIVFSFGIGYAISALLGLRLAPASQAPAAPSSIPPALRAAGPAGETPAGTAVAGTAAQALTGKHAEGTQKGAREPEAEGTRKGARDPDATDTDRGA